MYCILVTGIPASGKSTMAEYLSEALCIPMLSKDKIKEILFDTIGFHSRAEKVALGTGAMGIMYYFAEQMMKTGQPFILENNFENVSKPGIQKLLSRYGCHAVTVRLFGDDSRGNGEHYPSGPRTGGLYPWNHRAGHGGFPASGFSYGD